MSYVLAFILLTVGMYFLLKMRVPRVDIVPDWLVEAEPTAPEPEPRWPGSADEYEIVYFRDTTRRVIEERRGFDMLSEIVPSVESARRAGVPGTLYHKPQGAARQSEVARWS